MMALIPMIHKPVKTTQQPPLTRGQCSFCFILSETKHLNFVGTFFSIRDKSMR